MAALYDVQGYLPKVKRGGFIWMDDVQWPSVKKAVQEIEKHCDLWSDQGSYSLYKKI